MLRFEGAVEVQRLRFRREIGRVGDLEDGMSREIAVLLFGNEYVGATGGMNPLASWSVSNTFSKPSDFQNAAVAL